MQDFCVQFGPCSAIPAEWHWLMATAMPLLILIVGDEVATEFITLIRYGP